MKTMKKIFSFLLICMMLAGAPAMLGGCRDENPPEVFPEEIRAGIAGEYQALLAQEASVTKVTDITRYLMKWAASRSIRASHDEFGNVIMSKKAGDGREDAKAFTIHCSIGTDHFQQRAVSIASCLCIIDRVSDNHFVRILFTNDQDHSMTGAKGLKSRFLDSDYFISLDWSSDTDRAKNAFTIIDSGAASLESLLTQDIRWREPRFSSAYQITLSRLNSEIGEIDPQLHPNPVKVLGRLLAELKTKGILYDIGGFSGFVSPCTPGGEASFVIVINDNDTDRFEKAVTADQNAFRKKYEKTETEYQYTMTPAELPEKVISNENTNTLVSLLYTVVNGVYQADEKTGTPVALSSIRGAETGDQQLTVTLYGASVNQDALQSLEETFRTVAALCDARYHLVEKSPFWPPAEKDSDLLRLIRETGQKYYEVKPVVETTFEQSECAIFEKRGGNPDVLAMKINEENHASVAAILMELLQSEEMAGSEPEE